VVAVLDAKLRSIDYTTDFKGGVKEPHRHDAYLAVWKALRALQRE
jgi:hypothetical protein